MTGQLKGLLMNPNTKFQFDLGWFTYKGDKILQCPGVLRVALVNQL